MRRNTPKASHIAAHDTFQSLEINPQCHKLQFWQHILMVTKKIQTMKKHLLIAIVLLSTSCFGQKITMTDLTTLCCKKDIEIVNTILTQKGWEYYESQKGDSENFNTITWSFEKSYDNKAQSWFYLYTNNGAPEKIVYTVYNKTSYLIIQNSIISSGFKLIKSEINDNTYSSSYSNMNFILKVGIQKGENNDYYNSSTTSYIFWIVKKNSAYDVDNGKKYTYFDNGKIKEEYSLINGKVNGVQKTYYENGNVQITGNYINEKGNGKFYEYDENGNILADYAMINDEINGIFTIYENGLKSQEITKIKGKNNGLATLYFYNKKGDLSSKVIGNFIDDKKNGKWETMIFQNSKVIVVETKNYIDDIKNGYFKEFIGSDTLETKQYKNGLLDGAYKREVLNHWMITDSIGEYKDASFWSIESEGQYIANVQEGKWSYYLQGNKISEGNYINGLKDGKWLDYVIFGNQSGSIYSETEYNSGVKHGLYKCYFERQFVRDTSSLNLSLNIVNISIIETQYYSFGKKNGEYVLKDSLGKTVTTGSYLNDLKENIWDYYDPDNSHYSIEYKNNKRIVANNFDENNELYLKETYSNDSLQTCDFFDKTILKEKYLIQKVNYGYKVIVLEYGTFPNDSISSFTYTLGTDEEYSHQQFFEKAFKDGEYKLFVKNITIIEGMYCQDKKCSYWIYNYPKSNVYATKYYNKDTPGEEKYYNDKTKKPYNGKLEIFENGEKIIVKIKNGLKNGKTVIFSPDGKKVREVKYKDGVEL